MNNLIIFEELKKHEIELFSNMVEDVFNEFVGNDYSDEGKEAFKDFIKPQNVLARLDKNESIIYIAKSNDEIVGVLEVKNKNHISLFFVKKEFHNKGIGKRLFKKFLNVLKQENNENKVITVNSSFYAEEIYSRLGFNKKDKVQEKNGIKFIPMEYKIF
jgi:predicted GNAT family N-acyltransferase